VHPYTGSMVLLISVVVVLVGGLGNIKGTFVAAFALGMVMTVTGRVWGPATETADFCVTGFGRPGSFAKEPSITSLPPEPL